MRAISILFTLVATIISGVFLYLIFGSTSIPNTQIEPASGNIIQLDSFIGGGLIVGFFYFWERWEHLWGEKKRGTNKPKEPNLFKEFIPTVIGFVLSGLLAVWASLTLNLEYVEWALAFFTFGILYSIAFLLDLQDRLRKIEEHLPPDSA